MSWGRSGQVTVFTTDSQKVLMTLLMQGYLEAEAVNDGWRDDDVSQCMASEDCFPLVLCNGEKNAKKTTSNLLFTKPRS